MEHSENLIISKVKKCRKYYTISTTNGTGFILYTKYKVKPKVGDTITLYTKRFSFIRGMDLNGVSIFYKTDEELEEHRLKEIQIIEEKKQKQFKKNVKRMDEQFNRLPMEFQERIKRFRILNDQFRVDYEDYELFCSEQAVIIAEGCGTPENIILFKNKSWEEQIKEVPKLSDGHSGNTFYSACNLAYWYLSQPENIKKITGSLAPLVGSDEYNKMKL